MKREMLQHLAISFSYPSISQNYHWICGPHVCLHMRTINPMVILRIKRMREGQENEI
jgi:hypothetical protein